VITLEPLAGLDKLQAESQVTAYLAALHRKICRAFSPPTPADLEDTVRRAALKRYLEGDEEQSLDLLAVARAMAGAA
jgi:hypothetical protein